MVLGNKQQITIVYNVIFGASCICDEKLFKIINANAYTLFYC